MLEISEADIQERMRVDNPWWDVRKIDPEFAAMRRRAYFPAFAALVEEREVRRAVVLMGPRRVGKTVMIFHLVQKLIDGGADPSDILYLSLDTPLYNRIPLEKMFTIFLANFAGKGDGPKYVLYDEIQYLKDWEVHLKSLVDTYRQIRFVASGSAAAALRMKSGESGAGRFTDFMLPPLSFSEYLDFRGLTPALIEETTKIHETSGSELSSYNARDISKLNEAFADYLTFGGYPELATSERVRSNFQRYIRSDIIDSVLLRDLPSLYGIGDIQELNNLFTTLRIQYRSGSIAGGVVEVRQHREEYHSPLSGISGSCVPHQTCRAYRQERKEVSAHHIFQGLFDQPFLACGDVRASLAGR